MNPSSKFYTRGSKLFEEEDTQHEFKGHRTVCQDEMSPHFTKLTAKGLHRVSTRQPWSKTLCGFLNCCLGGTLYSGVLDDGTVSGLLLSPYQQLHIQLALEDTLARFQPPLSKEMYKLTFVPVVEPGEQLVTSGAAASQVDQKLWQLRHKLRSYRNCWCDNDSMASVAMGVIPEFFVLKIEVKGAEAGIIYLAEDGICYMRKSARNEKYTVVEVRDLQEERRRQVEFKEKVPINIKNMKLKEKDEDLKFGFNAEVMDLDREEKSVQDLDLEWMKDDQEFLKRRKDYYQKVKSNLQKQINLLNIDLVL
eukprot:GFUD01016291.1.p1 GENE.GFUD01016291.1~~GFUD01016291.1.p1  ORF type:complete len:307 (-),score=100.80 GFUD01016291.1:289-1209(-)